MNHTFIKTILLSILCLQINFIDCTSKRSKPFTDQERTQLINGFNNALVQKSDLGDANLALLEQVIEYRKTYGKIILNDIVNDYSVSYYPDYDGTTFLLEAARAGNLTLVQYLLKVSAANNPNNKKLTLAGEDINYQRRSGSTALHFAAASNHYDIVHLLVSYGADVNIQDKNGWTALHRAMQDNFSDVAGLLIRHGADVNIQDTWGWTALHCAASCNSLEIARLLIIHGANPYIKNNKGKTALDIASPEMQKVIQQAIADR